MLRSMREIETSISATALAAAVDAFQRNVYSTADGSELERKMRGAIAAAIYAEYLRTPTRINHPESRKTADVDAG